jgi:hypothetical protein
MAYDSATHEVVLFGGMVMRSSGGALSDTWVWDGMTWSQRAVSPHPPGRLEASAAYDRTNHRLLLFGGVDSDGTPYGDTWTWDGASWRQEHPANNPPPRRGAAIAYDDALGKIVMFGGWNPVVGGPAKLHDTWVWDASGWRELSPATVPSKRGSAVMDYDSKGGKLVMFGGDTGDKTNETWTFDGHDWSLMMEPAGASVPLAREATVMARNDSAGTLVLFGGEELVAQSTARLGNDTWTWNGHVWTEQHPTTKPPARGVETLASTMAYDEFLGLDVLYGGMNGGGALGDTWTWNGSKWTEVSNNAGCP